MRAVVQRVFSASVTVEGELVGQIGAGIIVFLAIERDDDRRAARWLASKVCRLRIFPDESVGMNLSVLDTRGECLVVSQFTLYGSCNKGTRPSFSRAAAPNRAISLYERFISDLVSEGVPVASGRFGADMKVSVVNDGPVTLIVDTPDRNPVVRQGDTS